MSDAQYDARRAAQVAAHRRDIELVRQWWLGEMIGGRAPLRESLTLFFESTFGGSVELADVPHAVHGRNATIRRLSLGTVPALLDALIVDPAMLAQIGMDEHFRARVSDRPAKLVLDHWTVGAGNYTDADVENLSRALTGWRLESAPGAAATTAPDPAAVRVARRTGLTPVFVPDQADRRAKTILGTTADFDARSAMRLLALHPATARRFSQRLLLHLGVEAESERLTADVAAAYISTGGSIEAMLRAIVDSDDFWSPSTRWALIKSPVHLAVGAGRQLQLGSPPLAGISRWLTACGQTLFDTPNNGEGGWPGQEAWVTPPDRLAVRYQLGTVLGGQSPRLGVTAPARTPAPDAASALAASFGAATAAMLVERLDPAPGIDAAELERAAAGPAGTGGSRRAEIIRRIMMTPQYQLA